MQIAILGGGAMGAPLAAILRAAGRQVDSLGRSDDPAPAISKAETVVMALKYEQALAFVRRPGMAGALAGKVVIDITNPLAQDFMSLTIGHETSAGEELARALPGAHVIKAFNTIFASVLADHAAGKRCTLPVFIAGDDEGAVDKVAGLVSETGLQAIRAGALSNSRYLEPMTELMIQFGYGLGHGDRIGFSLRAAA
ncbi:MAG: NADPH-dependent F420 reductase [Pikeienuella sp.]